MTESRTRFDQRLAALGPDILADDSTSAPFLRRLREDDPTRGIGDALLDQRNIAGDRQPVEGGGLLRCGHRPVAAAPGGLRRGGAGGRARRCGLRCRSPRDHGPRETACRVRPRRPALSSLRHDRSAPVGRATTTARPSGAPDARPDPRRAQGRRPRGARQHHRELRGSARVRRGHDRVRRSAAARRAPGAGPRLRGRRSRDAAAHSPRGSTTSRARPTAAWSWTWTSSCPGYEREVVEGLRERGLTSAR